MANATGNELEQETDWISLMDYASEYGVSLSTLRRHIKSGKVKYKVENGRYLLRSPFAKGIVPAPRAESQRAPLPASTDASAVEIRDLKSRLQRAQEEISELKMLVALYEEQLTPKRPVQPQRVNGY
jgi:hypothetical protein